MINAFELKTTRSHHRTANNIVQYVHMVASPDNMVASTRNVHTAHKTAFVYILSSMFTVEAVIRVMKSQTAKTMMAKMSTNIYFTCVFTTPKLMPCLRLICDYVNEKQKMDDELGEASECMERYSVIMAVRLRMHCTNEYVCVCVSG